MSENRSFTDCNFLFKILICDHKFSHVLSPFSFHRYEFVVTGAYSELFSMFKRFGPRSVRITVLPYISVIMEMIACHIVSELAVSDRFGLLAQIHACHIKSDRIK